MASEADRMIDDAEGRSGKAPPPSSRQVGGYESLSQMERQQLARTVAGAMGGRGGDVARVLDAMNTNPNFATQQLQRHGASIGLGLNEANQMTPEREGMDYVNPASLQSQTQAAPQAAPKRQAAPAAQPQAVGPSAAAGADATGAPGGGGIDPMTLLPLALAAIRKGANPQQVAQELAKRGVPPEAIQQALNGEVLPPEGGRPPAGMLEGPVVDGTVNRQALPPAQGKLPPPPLDDTGGAGQPPAPAAPQDGGGKKAKKPSAEDAMVEEATKGDTVEGKAEAKAAPKKPKQPKSKAAKEEPKNEVITRENALRRQSEDAWIRGGDMPPYLRRVVR